MAYFESICVELNERYNNGELTLEEAQHICDTAYNRLRYARVCNLTEYMVEAGYMKEDEASFITETLYDNYIEGSVINNIPRKEAKKAGNYGKDKLTEDEKEKHFQKRVYKSTHDKSIFKAGRDLVKATGADKGKKKEEALKALKSLKPSVTEEDLKKDPTLRAKIASAYGIENSKDLAQFLWNSGFSGVPGVGGSFQNHAKTASNLVGSISPGIKGAKNKEKGSTTRNPGATKARISVDRWLQGKPNSKAIKDMYYIKLPVDALVFKDTKSGIPKLDSKKSVKALKEELAKIDPKKMAVREIPTPDKVKNLILDAYKLGKNTVSIPITVMAIDAINNMPK